MVGFGWLALAMVGFGWLWLTWAGLVGLGWLRMAMAGFGWLRLALVTWAGFGWLREDRPKREGGGRSTFVCKISSHLISVHVFGDGLGWLWLALADHACP